MSCYGELTRSYWNLKSLLFGRDDYPQPHTDIRLYKQYMEYLCYCTYDFSRKTTQVKNVMAF